MTALADLTLEDVLTGKGFADLPASPLQLAVVPAAAGRPLEDVIDTETTERHFGVPQLGSGVYAGLVPTLVLLLCGVRGGKSFLAACAAIHAALTAVLDRLKHHEIPRAVIIGPTVDSARATFVLLLGILQSSPILRRFIEGEPTTDSVTIVRPDGRRVEIVVVAAHRGGLSVRNRWLVYCALEESAQFYSAEQGAAVTVEDLEQAAITRLLDGCQVWHVTSPFGPSGRVYDLYKRHFGRPGRTLVVHAPTRALNPSFPQERIDAVAAEQPDVAAREYGAEFIDAESAKYPASLVDPATRSTPLIRTGRATAGAMDPAARGNTWTFSVAWSEQGEGARTRVIVAGVWSWQGSKTSPLSPRAVLAEIAGIMGQYGLSSVHTDGWSFDSLQDHARAAGITLIEHPNADRDLPYQRLGTMLANGDIELPPEPTLRGDLLAVRQRATANGIKITLPKTANGRHCDTVPSVALAAHYATTGAGSSELTVSEYGNAGGRGEWRGAPRPQPGAVFRDDHDSAHARWRRAFSRP